MVERKNMSRLSINALCSGGISESTRRASVLSASRRVSKRSCSERCSGPYNRLMTTCSFSRGRSLSRFKKLREGFERVLGNVVFDTLGIGFGRLAGDAERAQHIDHQAMPQPYPLCQRPAFFGQKHAAVGTRGGKTGALEP